jgi:hypothetical protein
MSAVTITADDALEMAATFVSCAILLDEAGRRSEQVRDLLRDIGTSLLKLGHGQPGQSLEEMKEGVALEYMARHPARSGWPS